jgi:hypothetical protein
MKRLFPLLCLLVLAQLPRSVASGGVLGADGREYFAIGQCDQPSYNVRLSLVAPPGAEELRSLAVLFGADEAGNGYVFRADGRDWTLRSFAAGGSATLARGTGFPLPSADLIDLIVERRDWLLSVAVGGRVVAEVADAAHFGGLVGVDPMLCGPGDEPIIQAVGKLHFEDGFMRPDDDLSLGQWEAQAGHWRLHSVREEVDDINLERLPERRRPQSERSANPFSLSGRAEGPGLATTGYWFWDDYRAAVSLKDDGVDAAGLAFNVRSPDDFFLLRWENDAPTLRPTHIELLRVLGGRRSRLAGAWVNGEQGQWYRLAVETQGRRIRAFLDDAAIMDVCHDECVGGRIGLYVEGGAEGREALFDDVEVRSAGGYDFDDELWLTEHVASRAGEWRTRRAERPARPPNTAAVLSAPDGRIEMGHAGWPASLVRARLSAPATGQRIGFEVSLGQDDVGPLVVALEGTEEGRRLVLSRRCPEGEVELGACEAGTAANDLLRLEADGTRPGELNVYLDGRLELHVPRDDAAGGAIAAFAEGFRDAEFRDLSVRFERREDREREPRREVFREDPFMLHWSSPKGAWWPAEGRDDAWWHVGDFFGRSEVELPLRAGVLFVHSASAVAAEGGYALVQEASDPEQEGPGGLRLRLLREGQEMATAQLERGEAEGRRLLLCKEGRYLWARFGEREVLAFRDPDPLPGTRAALEGLSEDQLGDVKVQRCNVRDYLFDRAPADWHRVGDWRVTTRFACDPRWSFMTAIATQNAALFSKFRYGGDVTLEAYMGARMPGPDRGGRYWRIGDFNLALCEDLLDLNGGYKFVVAGWDRFWSDRETCLWKGTERVAGTTERLLPNVRRESTHGRVIDVPWIRGGRDIHGAWYYIKARKQGGRLASYVDNRQAYAYEDAEPLSAFNPAVWTYDSHIVVARVRLSYERKVVPGRLVAPPTAREVAGADEGVGPVIVSRSHPGFFDDFEGSGPGWRSFEDQRGAAPGLTALTAASGRQCLRVLNPAPGGLMEAMAPLEDTHIRMADARLLSFDYCIPPNVKINLFFKAGRQYYYIHLNGPDEASAFYRRLGELPVKADEEWHHAEFSLAAAYRDAGGDPDARIERAVFGNLHRGLLQAGIGSNPAGAAYYVDNFTIASVGPAAFAASVRGAEEAAQVLTSVEREPLGPPASTEPLDRELPSPGEWVARARAVGPDGSRSAEARLPFVVATAPLTVTAADPAPGSSWHYGPFELQFAAEHTPFLNPDSLRLTVNGEAVGPTPGLLRMGWRANRLTVDLTKAGLHIPDGEPCRLELTYADQWGRPGAFEADYVTSLAADVSPPGPVTLEGYLPVHDFEQDTASWEDTRDVALLRDDSTAAAGRWSLMVQNLRWASAFMAFVRREEFSAGRYPILEFDYRSHPGVQFDMVANNPSGQLTVGLADRCRYGYYVGEVPEFQSDGTWHHAEVRLLEGLGKAPYRRRMHDQRWLALGDFGYRANATGAYYHVDNVRFVPLVSGLRELDLRWEAHDAAGVAGYSYLWSQDPEDLPDDEVDTAAGEGRFGDLPAPDAYFHVKARDAAGNWGPVSHFRFRVDETAPVVAAVSPTDGERSATSRIEVRTRDAGSAIDPEALTLSIDGRPYRPHSRGVSYDTESGRLVWDWVKGRPPEQRAVPDGAEVKMELTASDFAGNAAATYGWHWVMDHSLDRDPPTMPVLASPGLPVRLVHDFESDTAGWRNARGNDWGARLKQVWRDEEHGDHCLELFAPRAESHFDAVAFEQDCKLDEFPVLSFDYAMPEKVLVNMQVRINQAWFSVHLTSPKAAYRVIGKVPDIEADGQWRHVSLDLLKLARKTMPNASGYVLNAVSFGDPARNGNRKNARWFVDNLMLSGYAKPELEARWRAEDITGVAGYSVVFDEQMTTVPPRQMSTRAESGRFKAVGPGTRWLHVAATDGNGNWSHPRHLACPLAAPPAEPAAAGQ